MKGVDAAIRHTAQQQHNKRVNKCGPWTLSPRPALLPAIYSIPKRVSKWNSKEGKLLRLFYNDGMLFVETVIYYYFVLFLYKLKVIDCSGKERAMKILTSTACRFAVLLS